MLCTHRYMSFMLCKSVTRETCICLQHHNALGATLYPNLQLNRYRCAGILSKMPFSRTAVPESRQKQPQHSVLDEINSGLLFWQYTLGKFQANCRQSVSENKEEEHFSVHFSKETAKTSSKCFPDCAPKGTSQSVRAFRSRSHRLAWIDGGHICQSRSQFKTYT